MPELKDNADPAFSSAPRASGGFLAAATEAGRKALTLLSEASEREYSWYGLKDTPRPPIA